MQENKLSRIRCISASGRRVENLAHLIDKELLLECFEELGSKKAVGVDGVTKDDYGENIDENLDRLVSKMRKGAYYPQPSKRVYIPKPGTNKMRPLGISCFEDYPRRYLMREVSLQTPMAQRILHSFSRIISMWSHCLLLS